MSDSEEHAYIREYGHSSNGNYYVCGQTSYPHPYCITPKHVEIAADRHSGILNEAAIRDAEQRGAKCGMHECFLSYEEHKPALIVACHSQAGPGELQSFADELQAYLLTVVPLAKKHNVDGFTLLDRFTKPHDKPDLSAIMAGDAHETA